MLEVYPLDASLRRSEVVDSYVSLIWTERWQAPGDFELSTLPTIENLQRFSPDTLITTNKSKRVMRVETLENANDPEKGSVFKIKGKDITQSLEGRSALEVISGVYSPTWYITGKTPAETMRYMFNQICVLGTVSPSDPYSQYAAGTTYPATTIAESSDLINWEQKPSSLLAALEELAQLYDLGFRMYKDDNLSILYFNVYTGSDRTSAQTTLAPVIFSYDMENLQNTTEYTDISSAYNVVQVLYPHHDDVTDTDVMTALRVRLDLPAPSPTGLARKTKILTVSSIPDGVSDVTAFLTQAGIDELLKSRPIRAFDGEISQISDYVYERDYFLGDLIEARSSDGAVGFMRVTEHIAAQDAQGERSYPTLVTNKYIQAGAWLDAKYDIAWSATADSELWSNQP